MRAWLAAALLAAAPLVLAPAAAAEPAPRTLVVAPDGAFATLSQALQAARDGDVVLLRGGTHPGPVVVDKRVTLRGAEGATIDGGGAGTVVTLAAAGAALEGVQVVGSGLKPLVPDAAIRAAAPDVRVERNVVRDSLTGIAIEGAPRALARGNDVTGHPGLGESRRGDALRVWNSPDARIEGNVLRGTRDLLIWYSDRVAVVGNEIHDGRYGIHVMSCAGAVVEGNRIERGSVGIYLMIADGASIRDNLVRGQRGSSGYGIGLKDVSNADVRGNVLVDNRVGAYFDNTPYHPGAGATFADNVIAFHDVGVRLLPSVRGNLFTGNTLHENVRQVQLHGGTGSGGNEWRGNHWSGFLGVDLDGDGFSEEPYRSERLFEALEDREPRLRVLLYSPLVQALEHASAAFPIVRPEPLLVDESPRMAPAPLPAFALSAPPAPPPARAGAGPAAALAVLGGMVLAGVAAPVAARAIRRPRSEGVLVEARGVRKSYGGRVVLGGVSLRVEAGRALALWGGNGAGKTTLLRCLLGVARFEGSVLVGGRDARKDGKAARRALGYVPQDVALDDVRVRVLMTQYARLRGADAARVESLLLTLGLAEHAEKGVSSLSGGLRQRLALGLALLGDPPVLLLDEPTANLDAAARRDYLALLARLRDEGRAIVFTSHRVEEVARLADDVLVLEPGRAHDPLPLAEFLAREERARGVTLRVPPAAWPAARRALAAAGLPAEVDAEVAR